MSVDPDRAKSIFLAVVEKPPAEQSDYLSEVTAGDDAVRARVEALLQAHLEADSFLERPAAQFGATLDLSLDQLPLAEGPGAVIGPYKLLEQIGEGGMGIVYMADQQAPVRRRVALKIIKPGMDTRQVIARFEAERQALALMDHSNIARVLDAGGTNSGRPYFVMELVRGVPITEYCDQNNLSVPARLELFVQVCHAVQHAHQKGIIHRDIKPSNVMVTVDGGRAVPKVIDFGVAKATNQQLTDKTLFTNFSQMIGTPLYMSPEQAEMTSLDVDTRADIYSLGVLLYELLTGTTPFEKLRLHDAPFDEIRRIIREEEPPKPSTRISTSRDTRTATATHRQVDPDRLGQLLCGDLDWIVMKSIDKDRNQRYETAAALARDVQRYLADEPVEACPPSAAYRFRKFARRNRVALTTAVLVSSSLVLGTFVSTWQAVRATRAEHAAEAARSSETLQRTEAERQSEQAKANYESARSAVDSYFTLVSENKLLDVPGLQPLRTDLLEAALRFYRELAAKQPDDPAMLADLAVTYLRVGVVYHTTDRNDDAILALKSGLEVVKQLRGNHPGAARHHQTLAGFWKGWRRVSTNTALPRDPVMAFAALQDLVELWERFALENPGAAGFQSDLAAAYYLVGDMLTSSGETAQGLVFLRKARERWDVLVHEHPDVAEYRADLARTCEDLASRLERTGSSHEIDEAARTALTLRSKLVEEFPDVPQHRLDLVDSLKSMSLRVARAGQHQEAEELCGRAIALCRDMVNRFPLVPLYRENLILAENVLMRIEEQTGKLSDEQAERSRLDTIAQLASLASEFPSNGFFPSHLARRYHDLAHYLRRRDRSDEAIAAFRREKELIEALVRDQPIQPNHRLALANANLDLGALLVHRGHLPEGDALCQQSRDALEKLVAEFPANPEYVHDLGDCRQRMSEIASGRDASTSQRP